MHSGRASKRARKRSRRCDGGRIGNAGHFEPFLSGGPCRGLGSEISNPQIGYGRGMVPRLIFAVVPVTGALAFTDAGWRQAQHMLLEMQPASRVSLVGDPPTAIRIEGLGLEPEIAPAVLAFVSEHAGVKLKIEAADPHAQVAEWARPMRDGTWTDPDGVCWRRRGGPLEPKAARRLIRRPEIQVVHAYGAQPRVVDGAEAADLLARVQQFLDGDSDPYSAFTLGEFRDDARRVLLIVEELC